MEQNLTKLMSNDRLQENLIEVCEFFCRVSRSQLGASPTRDAAWLALSKILHLCDSEMLKSISSRMQKRLLDIEKQPVTLATICFVHAVLKCMPSFRRYNAKTFSSIVPRLVDFAVNCDRREITNLVGDIYAFFSDGNDDDFLLRCIRSCLDGKVEMEISADGNLRFSIFQRKTLRETFVATIFYLHCAVIRLHSSGTPILLYEWLTEAKRALRLNISSVIDAVLFWLGVLIENVRSVAIPALNRISSLLMDHSSPSTAFYRAVSVFSSAVGPPSANFFNCIISSAQHPLHLQPYGEAYADAVSSLLMTAAYALKPRDVLSLQHKICSEALLYPDSLPVLRILNALLSINLELVPVPIQIAQSVFAHSGNRNEKVREEILRGKSLCACISRPRMQFVVPFDKWLNKMEQISCEIREDHREPGEAAIKERKRKWSGDDEVTSKPSAEIPLITEGKIPRKVSGRGVSEVMERVADDKKSEVTEAEEEVIIIGSDADECVELKKMDSAPVIKESVVSASPTVKRVARVEKAESFVFSNGSSDNKELPLTIRDMLADFVDV